MAETFASINFRVSKKKREVFDKNIRVWQFWKIYMISRKKNFLAHFFGAPKNLI